MSLRIIYVGRHGQTGSNDDEGAVTHALRVLGHDVQCVQERHARSGMGLTGDLCIFNKWPDTAVISQLDMPRVFWWWDLVSWHGDQSIRHRCESRAAWMRQTVPIVDVGFLSDGDFVNADTTGKLVWLTQGADERVAGKGVASDGPDILFTGISRHGGRQRESFVAEMHERYGERFRHVSSGVHGRELADMIASARIVVAPDSPVTDAYWSNRAFLTLGFGGFLLHPYAAGLANMYTDGREIVFYEGRHDLHEKIQHYLDRPEEREAIAAAGLVKTLARHTYRHRCEELIRVVRERLCLS